MAKYKSYNYSQEVLIPVCLEEQLMPGTLEFAIHTLMEPHVKVLRDYRDSYLLSLKVGRMIVKTYYRHSPPVADFIAKHDTLKTAVQIGLLPLVAVSYVALHFGMTITVCGLLLIFVLPIFLIPIYSRIVRFHKVNI